MPMTLTVGEFEIRADERRLVRAGQPQPLGVPSSVTSPWASTAWRSAARSSARPKRPGGAVAAGTGVGTSAGGASPTSAVSR